MTWPSPAIIMSGAMRDPHQVHLDDPVHDLVGDAVDRVERSRACVGEEQQDIAEGVGRLGMSAANRGAIGDVALHGERAPACLRDLRRDSCGPVPVDIGDSHRGSLAPERDRQSAADAAARAGDEGDFAGNLSHANASSPSSVTRCRRRPQSRSNGIARCIVPVLSQISRSPMRHSWR
jgi:hypothetical protein